MDQELKSFKSLNIFESPLSIRTLSSLAKVKGAQVQRRFDDCQKSGLVLLGNSEVKEWLATTIMECGLAAPESKKKSAELKKIIVESKAKFFL